MVNMVEQHRRVQGKYARDPRDATRASPPGTSAFTRRSSDFVDAGFLSKVTVGSSAIPTVPPTTLPSRNRYGDSNPDRARRRGRRNGITCPRAKPVLGSPPNAHVVVEAARGGSCDGAAHVDARQAREAAAALEGDTRPRPQRARVARGAAVHLHPGPRGAPQRLRSGVAAHKGDLLSSRRMWTQAPMRSACGRKKSSDDRSALEPNMAIKVDCVSPTSRHSRQRWHTTSEAHYPA